MEEAKDSIVFCYISSNFQLDFMDWLWFAFFFLQEIWPTRASDSAH